MPALALTAPYCAVQFTVLQQCKRIIRRQGWDSPQLVNAASFLGGATAGAAATLASYPFDLLRTILASQGSPPLYRGMVDAGRAVVRQRGLAGLYSGVGITLTEIVPYAGIQFGTYDLLTRWSESVTEGVELSAQARFGRQFLVGLLAGFASKVRHLLCAGPRATSSTTVLSQQPRFASRKARSNVAMLFTQWHACTVSTAPARAMPGMPAYLGQKQLRFTSLSAWLGRVQGLTHPLDVVKKRYQITGLERSLHYGRRIEPTMTSSLRSCVSHIWRHEGAAGFYKGLTPSLIKVRIIRCLAALARCSANAVPPPRLLQHGPVSCRSTASEEGRGTAMRSSHTSMEMEGAATAHST